MYTPRWRRIECRWPGCGESMMPWIVRDANFASASARAAGTTNTFALQRFEGEVAAAGIGNAACGGVTPALRRSTSARISERLRVKRDMAYCSPRGGVLPAEGARKTQ